MAISGIAQPALIGIDDVLRLRRFDGVFDFALPWYQDEALVYLVDGVKSAYTMEKLSRMYRYLDNAGELYWIEALENGAYRPIGDVTFWQEDLPIVIGDPGARGHHVGRRVLSALIQRGRALGFDHMAVGEIYDWNEASRRCFESVGFQAYEKTEKGARYRLTL